jgi:diguanylate cyclase (GGDEF)-like protein
MNFDLRGLPDILPCAVFDCQKQDSQIPQTEDDGETMRIVLNNIRTIIYVSDFDTHEILFANNYLKEILAGKGIMDAEGKICWQTIQKGQKGPCSFCPCPTLRGEEGLPGESCTWEHKNTLIKKWFLATDSAIQWTDGRYVHMEVAWDISSLKEKEKELRQKAQEMKQKAQELKVAASIDPLTGTYNRQMGGVLLEEAWKRAVRSEKKSTLCFLDLDALKEVNDSYGHGAGDHMLIDFTALIKKTIRKADTFCRWGGDEFILLLEGCTKSDSEKLTLRRIQRHVDVFNQSKEAKKEYLLSFSYGLQEISGDETLSLEQIIALADQKMYEQKMRKKLPR